MPHLGPIAARNLTEANRVRGVVPPEIAPRLTGGGGLNRISSAAIVAVLKDKTAWAAVTSVPAEQIGRAKHALLDYLAKGDKALEALGLTEVPLPADTREQKGYAKAARQSLRSYLPKEDVDSVTSLQRYFADDSYVHLLLRSADAKSHYTSGFIHDLAGTQAGGRPARVIQLDFHEILEGKRADAVGGKIAFARFLASAQHDGAADFLFVEVTPEMRQRYLEMEPQFVDFARPGTRNVGDKYALLALPLSRKAFAALAADKGKAVFDAYVDSWCEKNLEAGWQRQPGVQVAVEEMKQSKTPIWNQPPLPA